MYLTKNGAGFIKELRKKVLLDLGEYGVFESTVYVPGHSFPVYILLTLQLKTVATCW